MSAYASLFNIDVDLPERLISFVALPSSDEQIDYEAETMRYVVDNDISNFLRKIFERTEHIIEHANDEGSCYYDSLSS